MTQINDLKALGYLQAKTTAWVQHDFMTNSGLKESNTETGNLRTKCAVFSYFFEFYAFIQSLIV